MRNLKKLVALIVTLAMIATFAIPAFAAAPADVAGTDYEGAVTRLAALGVITGYPNGDFGPNDTITRAQFAAVIVRALGYEEVAATSKGTTKFSDVAASHWASGYINLAVSLGIIKGNPDGTFAPDAPVLYEQAVTMVVRALGQEFLAEQKGGYPSGYLVQAKVIGFTDDVKGVSGTAATRGIVALLVDNAKDVTIYEQTGFGDSQTYEETEPDENFLTRLGMKIREDGDGVIVTETPGSTGVDENDFVVSSGKTFTAIAGAVDIEPLLGKKVDVWGSADDEIVLVEESAGTKVVVASVDEAVYDDDDGVVGVKVTLADDTEEEYTFVDDAAAIDTFGTADIGELIDQLAGLDSDKYQVSMVVDDDDLLFVDAIVFDVAKEASAFTENKVAEWIKLSGYYIKRGGDDIKKLVIEKDGAIVDYKAIEDDDILFVAVNEGTDTAACDDDRLYIKATNKTVAGTLQGAKPSLADATSIKVEGTWYDVSAFLTDIDASGLIGGEITLTLDPAGKAYSIDGEEEGSDDLYGVILGNQFTEADAIDDAVYKVKILNAAGDEVVYTVDDEVEAVKVANSALEGRLAAYTLDSDGVVDSMVLADVLNPDLAANQREIDTDKFGFGPDDMDSDVVFFTADDVVALADIEDDSDAAAAAILRADPEDDDSDIVAILFGDTATIPDGYVASESEDNYGYISDFTVTDTDEYSVDVITKDGAKTYTYENAIAPVIGDFVVFTLDSDNNMDDVLAAEDDIVAGVTVTDVSATKISTINTADVEEDYWFADDAIFVDDDDPAESGAEVLANADMYEDMEVTLYLDDNGDVMLVIVTDM